MKWSTSASSAPAARTQSSGTGSMGLRHWNISTSSPASTAAAEAMFTGAWYLFQSRSSMKVATASRISEMRVVLSDHMVGGWSRPDKKPLARSRPQPFQVLSTAWALVMSSAVKATSVIPPLRLSM